MLARFVRRAPLCLLLVVSAAACEDKAASPPLPAPDRASTASAPKESTSAEAKLAPPPSTAVVAASANEIAPSAALAAQPVQAPEAALKDAQGAPPSPAVAAKTDGKASEKAAKAPAAVAGGTSAAAPALPADLPPTTDGILPPGAADKILPVGARPIVKLVEPGSEPRAELVYSLTKGAKQTLGMSMDMVMGLKMGVQAMPPVVIPRMAMFLDMTPGEKDSGGDWKVDALLQRVAVEPKGPQQQEMARQIAPNVEGMKGLTMAYFVTPKGHVHDVKISTPPGFPAQAQQMLNGMSQSFESMVSPLPSEPVGVGAKWQVTTRVASAGADLLQFATYILKEKSGSQATLNVTVAQVAASDAVNAPGMPAGASAKLKAFHSGGSGMSKIDTKSVAPSGGRMSVKSGMDLEVSVGGAGPAQRTSVDTTLDVEFTKPGKN